MKKFSPQVIVFLAGAITGGPGTAENQSPWPYRAGWQLVRFFKECGYELEFGQSSRVPWTEERLDFINKNEGSEGIIKVISHLTDPRDWIGKEELLKQLVFELNKLLFYDGYEIVYRKDQRKFLLRERSSNSPAVKEVLKKDFFNTEAIKKDFDRILTSISSDPADSITASCSFVESVCKHILDTLSKPYPKEQTINSLAKEVLRHLSLLPEDTKDEDFKKLLGSLGNIAQSIGSMRTKFGDAHGHTVDPSIINPLHARLAANAASTLSIFLIEAFETQGKFEESRKDRVRKLVEEYHATVMSNDRSDPLPFSFCPKCGGDGLERQMAVDEDRDETYFSIKCKECGWDEWTQ